MIGFAVYSYEGVGVVLPILDVTAAPEKFNKILFAVLTTVTVSYVAFGEFCYIIYGSDLTNPIVTENLPYSTIPQLVKIIFCINLIFSYPLVIYPANMVIESYMYGSWAKTKKRQWMKNLNRTIMVAFTIVISLLMGEQLDKFLSINGSLFCTPIAFILPTLFHYKLVAETKSQKNVDIAILVLAVVIMIFCTIYGVINWVWATD